MNSPNENAFNPYAAPAVDTHFVPGQQPGTSVAGSYYAMSVTKLWVMSIVTLGLYNVVFFYRHWRHLRDHGHQDVSPVLRAIFGPFTYFGLNSQVVDSANFGNVPAASMLSVAPIVHIVANGIGRVLDRMSDDMSAGATLLSFALVPVATMALAATQTTINRILQNEGYNGPVNDGVSAGSVIFGILGAIIWFLAFVGIFMGA